MPDDLFGYQIRRDLYPGEQTFFRQNPHTAGMASESGHIILNPFSGPEVDHPSVAKNEAFRLMLRDRNLVPDFQITDQQRQPFAGTAYEKDDNALKSTLAARIYSGDPSAQAVPEQQQWVERLLQTIRGR